MRFFCDAGMRRKGVKDLPILPQGFSAVFLEGLPAVLLTECVRKSSFGEKKCTPIIICGDDKTLHSVFL